MSKKARSYKKHRVCRLSGCKNLLSIYNPEAYCHIHHHIVTAKELYGRNLAGISSGSA